MAAPGTTGSSISLLLVEDDTSSGELIASLLACSFPTSAIFSASDGVDALELFRIHRPEIIITDVNMPGMDGIQLLRMIAAIKPETRGILITAHSDPEIRQRVEEAGIQAEFVPKPIDFKVLLASITRCMASFPR